MRTKLIATVLTAGLVSGCAVGPNYARPEVPTPAAFRADTAPADLASLADVKWFELFKDERLQEMIRTALVQNFDLRSAVVRVELARANLGITRADQFPTIEASAGITAQRSAGSAARAPLEPLRATCCRSRSMSGGGCAAPPKRHGLTYWPATTSARR